MKRLLALLMAVLLFLPQIVFAAAGIQNPTPITQDYINALNQDVADKTYGRITDFYSLYNKKGQIIRSGDLFPNDPDLLGIFNYAVWGPWSNDPNWDGAGGNRKDALGYSRARYIGYSKYGEAIGNVFFPPDYNWNGKPYPFEKLIPTPWENDTVKNAFPQFFSNYQNRINDAFSGKGMPDDLKMRIQFGYAFSAVANGFKPFDVFDPKVAKYEAYQNPQNFVHIVLPPTEDTMGTGLVFHSENGHLYYKSVPIPNAALMDELGLYQIPEDAIAITPKEQIGQPGTPVEFELNVRWDKIAFMQKFFSIFGYDLGFRVTLAHKTKSGSYPVDFNLNSLSASKMATQSYIDLLPGATGSALPASFERTASFKVTVQSVPTDVVAEIYPILAIRGGKTPVIVANNEDFLYKSAVAKVKPFMPDYAIQLTPSEQSAKSGDTVSFNLNATWKDHPTGQGFRVILAYQTPQGKLPVDFSLGGKTATKLQDVSYISFMTNDPQGAFSGTIKVKAYDKTSTLIAQVIPLDRNGSPLPIQQPYDANPDNNQAKALVKPLGIDYVALPYQGTFIGTIEYNMDKLDYKVELPFTRVDQMSGTVPYTITIRDSLGRTQTINGTGLKKHEMKYVNYTLSVTQPGTYWVEYEIWPVPKSLEITPENNKARVTIEINKTTPPYRPEPDRGLHVELRS